MKALICPETATTADGFTVRPGDIVHGVDEDGDGVTAGAVVALVRDTPFDLDAGWVVADTGRGRVQWHASHVWNDPAACHATRVSVCRDVLACAERALAAAEAAAK